MQTINEKNYEHFNSHERLKLAIAALARQDKEEVNRLWQSCPIRVYTARDLDYKEKFMSYTLICAHFFMLCADLYIRITKYSYILTLGSDNAKPPTNINNKQCALIARLKAVYSGFYQFCDQVGLKASDILKTIDFGALQHNEYLDAKFIDADITYANEVKEQLLSYWKV